MGRQEHKSSVSDRSSENKTPGPEARSGPVPGLMSAHMLDGSDVYNTKGEDLGDVKDLLLNMSDGKVGYAVLSFGSFLGMAEKLFAVPWKALTFDTENKRFILNIDKSRLKNAPAFDKDHWPDMADQAWKRNVHNYYAPDLRAESPPARLYAEVGQGGEPATFSLPGAVSFSRRSNSVFTTA